MQCASKSERPGDIRENAEQTGLDEKWLHCGGARNLASKVIKNILFEPSFVVEILVVPFGLGIRRVTSPKFT